MYEIKGNYDSINQSQFSIDLPNYDTSKNSKISSSSSVRKVVLPFNEG
jgi:hypothetical protein